MHLPEVGTVERLSLRPGDRLVLTVPHPLDQAEFDSLWSAVATWGMPEGVKVIILDSGMSLQVLAREDS
jgi:hypothetical protein